MKGSLEDIAVKEAKLFLKTLSDGLRVLAKGVESLAEQVEGMSQAPAAGKDKATETDAPKTARKTVRRRAKKEAKPAGTPKADKPAPASDIVYNIISASESGETTASLSEQTGFNTKKIHNIIYRLKRKGKIKNAEKGVYVKA